MKFKNILLLLVISFILQISGCKEVKSIYQFKVGDVHQYRVKLEYEKKAYGFTGPGIRRELPSAQSTLELLFTETVKSVGANGEFYLDQTIDDLELAQTESANLKTADALQKYVGQTFHIILYPNGRVEIQEEDSADPGVTSEFGIRTLIQKNKLAFPQKYLRHGFEWNSDKSEDLDALFYGKAEMTGKATYRLVGMETVHEMKTFRVDFQEKLETSEPKVHSMAPSPFTSRISGKQSLTGSAFFATNKRLPVKYEEHSQSSITIDVIFEKDEQKAQSQTINEIESKILIYLVK